jgi:Raf kinase inhibitor-like YbhB/YbcL family protein
MADLMLISVAFKEGAQVPARHTCEGDDVSPPLEWSGAPDGAASLALTVDDPDAPSGTFVHWLGWGIDPQAEKLIEGESPPAEGTNGFGTTGYRGPCPPPGHGPHRYFFRLYALDVAPDLTSGASREELDAAMDGHVLATAELVGTYERG